jgi:hypothetical protein
MIIGDVSYPLSMEALGHAVGQQTLALVVGSVM